MSEIWLGSIKDTRCPGCNKWRPCSRIIPLVNSIELHYHCVCNRSWIFRLPIPDKPDVVYAHTKEGIKIIA